MGKEFFHIHVFVFSSDFIFIERQFQEAVIVSPEISTPRRVKLLIYSVQPSTSVI